MSMHNHRCAGKSCGTIWCHDPSTITDSKKAHSCPKCGREQWVRGDYDDEPEFCSNGARALPVTSETRPALQRELEAASAARRDDLRNVLDVFRAAFF